ncbi:exodeoxyribonuclease VII large subunit, partial [bacterium]|nr:exodeoxyribonuclease VII large subunit [bacterium]
FECATPVVSAVGHEIDFTIADFVADVRAATPSAAMEIVLPDGAAIAHRLLQLERRLSKMTVDRVKLLRHELAALSSHWALRQPMHLVQTAAQTLDDLQARLNDSSQSLVADKQSQLHRFAELLKAVSPERILQRGYAVVRGPKGLVLRSASSVKPGDLLDIELADGNLSARTVQPNTPDLFDEQ